MKQMNIVILCIVVCLLCLISLPAAAMDAGPVTDSQGVTAVGTGLTPGGMTGQHTVPATQTQAALPPGPSVPEPLQAGISGIPVLMLAGIVMIALALLGFGYWYVFRK
jgi:hypothetical protein